MGLLEGKVALITGATRGIGKGIAEVFAKEGAEVAFTYAGSVDKAKALEEELGKITKVKSYQSDASDYDAAQQLAADVIADFGKIDILINNAGNAHGLESLIEGNVNDWDMMLDGNVKGLLYVSKMIMPGMKERNSGHIVNISSVAARQTYANGVVYCASKKSVDIISDGMRLELTQFGIKVTNIQPGAVETEFSKVRFKGDEDRAKTVYQGYEALKAADIADAIAYCVNAPKHVMISDLTIYPSAQSEPRTIHRK